VAEEPNTRDTPWRVAEVSDKLKGYIDRLGSVWVEGQISQWKDSTGNVFGRLKDLETDATLSFTIWSSVRVRNPGEFAQGDRVTVLLKPEWWVRTGELRMMVVHIKHVGIGDILENIEKLRTQLAAEGLFDPARKKRLPTLPHVIGLITGKDSDAEKDVLRNAHLRWPAVIFRTIHATVQGERSVPEILSALRELDADPAVDVIIIARGGGDFQNLLGFSDERLVRAVSATQTPVVSAIGHEADRPLLDEVADLRASTPTDAAKRVVPDVDEHITMISGARSRMDSRLRTLLTAEKNHIMQLRSRPVLAEPATMIDRHAEGIARQLVRGSELVERGIDRASAHIAQLRGQLEALSPLATLARGYAIVQSTDGRVIQTPTDAPDGTELILTVARGILAARSLGPGTAAAASPEE